MRTWFQCTVKYAKETEEGLLKSISEKYLVDAVSFTEAEAVIYDRLGEQIRGDFQVTHMAKSPIVDVFHYEDSDYWFKAKIQYLIADGETGREKKVTQFMLVTASDVPQAHERIQESLSNMLVSFQVPDVVASPIVEVFPYEKPDENPLGNFKPVDKSE
jgi:hypothetical protein